MHGLLVVLLQIHPVRSFASHAGSIWDVCSFCLPHTTSGLITSSSSKEDVGQQASGCATCGSDGTIRFWAAPDAAGSMQPLASVLAGMLGQHEARTNIVYACHMAMGQCGGSVSGAYLYIAMHGSITCPTSMMLLQEGAFVLLDLPYMLALSCMPIMPVHVLCRTASM